MNQCFMCKNTELVWIHSPIHRCTVFTCNKCFYSWTEEEPEN